MEEGWKLKSLNQGTEDLIVFLEVKEVGDAGVVARAIVDLQMPGPMQDLEYL